MVAWDEDGGLECKKKSGKIEDVLYRLTRYSTAPASASGASISSQSGRYHARDVNDESKTYEALILHHCLLHV